MKNMFKKSIATVMAVASLAVGMVGMSASALESNHAMTFSTEVMREDEAIIFSTTTHSFPYALNNTEEQYQIAISGTSTSAGNFTFSTLPSGGSVTLLIKNANGTTVASRVFDTGGHAPSLGVSVPAGETYYVYLCSSSASSRNPVTGTMYYTKNVV